MKAISRTGALPPALLALLLSLAIGAPALALLGDADGSGRVDGMDLIIFAPAFGSFEGDPRFDLAADFNRTGAVDGHDLAVLAVNFGRTREEEERMEWRAGEVLVKFHPGVGAARAAEILAGEGLRETRFYPRSGVHRSAVESGLAEDVAAARLLVYSEVEYAERNLICRPHFVPNDTLYRFQWSFDHLEMEAAWDIATGQPGVVVAVLDTGVAYEDYGQFRRATDLAGTRFTAPWDFVANEEHANDEDGHGTHVSGTIAQTTNNGFGVAGIAFNCTIMPLRVIDEDGGAHSDIAEALYWALDHGAKIANMSLGGRGSSTVMDTALAATYNDGLISFASSGNSADDPDWEPNNWGVDYPASHPDCVAVGAVRYDRQRSYYSQYGSDLEIVAPGGDTRVDQNDDGQPDGIVQQTYGSNFSTFTFRWWQGTSMSCPHASALAALLASLGVTEGGALRGVMAQTAVDLGAPGWDQEYGYGLINARQALTEAAGGGSGWID